MEIKKFSIGWFIIGSALVWGLAIIFCAVALRGTDAFDKIKGILGVASAIHLIIIMGPVGIQFYRSKNNDPHSKNPDQKP